MQMTFRHLTSLTAAVVHEKILLTTSRKSETSIFPSQIGDKAAHRLGALRGVAQPVADAVEVQAVLGQPVDVEFAPEHAAHPADRHVAAADRQCLDARRQYVGADVVDDHVDAAWSLGSPIAAASAAPKPSLPVTTPR